MFKKIRMYPEIIQKLSWEDFISSFKNVKKSLIKYFIVWIVLLIVTAVIIQLLSISSSFLLLIIKVFYVVSLIPVFDYVYKWIVHEEEHRRRTMDQPYDFEINQYIYDKVQKRTRMIGMALLLGILALLIVDRFLYSIGNHGYLSVAFMGITSLLLIHIFDLRKHIRKNYIDSHKNKKQ
jgi:hypothetical protein